MLLHIYTKDYGKVEAVARSARKAKGKLKGHLELFLFAELIFARGKNIDTITSSLTIESFSNLRNDLEFSFGAYYISELIDKIILEEHKDERIFYLLKKILLFLNGLADIKTKRHSALENKTRHYLAILMFQTHILDIAGFSPELDKCAACSRPITPGENYFSFKLGGIVSKECVSKSPDAILISDNAIKLIRLFQFKGNGELENYARCLEKCFEIMRKLKADKKLVLDAVFLMNKFIEFNIERKISGVDFI